MRFYILEGKKVVRCKDFQEWAQKWTLKGRDVKQDVLPGDICVSTVFLGIATNLQGSPLIFETMIFGGFHDGYQESYSTWEEAELGHQRAMYLVISQLEHKA